MRLRNLPFLALLALAGCLPSRDNPRDPANAPNVAVRFVDYTPPIGPCPAFADAAVLAYITAASRGRCLAVDASQTEDSRGQVIDDADAFRYVFRDPLTGASLEFADAGPVFEMSDELRRDLLSPNVLLAVEVHARDTRGNRGSIESGVVLLNAEPSVSTGPSRSVPLGGFTWAPGADIPLEFRAEADDPDGDELSLCWSFDGVDLPCGIPGDFSPAIDEIEVDVPARLIASVRAWDGDVYSTRAPAIVQVHPPNVWIANTFGVPGIERLDGDSSRIPIDTGIEMLHRVVDIAPISDDLVAVTYLSDPPNVHDSWVTACFLGAVCAAGLEMTSVPEINFALPLVVAPDGASLAVLDTPTSLRRFDVLGDGTLVASGPTLDPLLPANPYNDFLVAMDSAGGVAIATHAGFTSTVPGFLQRVDATGSIAVRTSNDTVDYVVLETRPGGGEVWAATLPFPGDDVPVSPGLEIWRADGSALRIPFLNGVSGLAFVDANRVWIAGTGEDLRLVDAQGLVAGLTLDEATIVTARVGTIVRRLIADPVTAECFATGTDPSTGLTAVFRVDPFGGVLAMLAPFGVAGTFIDQAGRMFVPGDDLRMDAAGAAGGKLAQIRAPGLYTAHPAYDTKTGGIWQATQAPFGLTRWAENGTQQEVVTSVREANGTVAPFPKFIRRTAISPDGSTLWAFEPVNDTGGYGLARFDLQQDPPAHVLVDSNPNAENSLQLLRPSSPASPPFVWVYNSPAGAIGTFPATAVAPLPFDAVLDPALPSFGYIAAAELAPASDDLCVARVDLASGLVDHLRLGADGTVIPMDSVSTAGMTPNSLGVLAGAAANDACFFWIGYDTPSPHIQLLAYSAEGNSLLDVSLTGVGAPLDGVVYDSRVWMLVSRPEGTTPLRVDVTLGPPGSATWQSLPVVDVDNQNRMFVGFGSP